MQGALLQFPHVIQIFFDIGVVTDIGDLMAQILIGASFGTNRTRGVGAACDQGINARPQFGISDIATPESLVQFLNVVQFQRFQFLIGQVDQGFKGLSALGPPTGLGDVDTGLTGGTFVNFDASLFKLLMYPFVTKMHATNRILNIKQGINTAESVNVAA